ncbi:DNA internalization-related competence protein ComEC/Rec2 [Haloechinothrix salitolerans]|uniref:DNA internalization-related competence protein ComEC/Rec2 n=1 Tax=Haloechinothrix salitolerans TaxID=926830 RepID=A0ABW2C4H2_9PSEU
MTSVLADRARHDFRLVPAAMTVWLAGLLGLLGTWWLAALCGGGVLATSVLPAVRRSGFGRRHGAAALGVVGVLCAVPVTLVLHGAEHDPLRTVAASGGEAVLDVALTSRARAIRAAGYAGEPSGGGRVVLHADVERAVVEGEPVASTGRVLLIASGEGWSGLVPGQRLRATGTLAPASSGELLVAVLRVRAEPTRVTSAPWWQRAARSMRHALRAVSAGVLDPDEAGLLPGLVVGDTSALPLRVEEEFLDAGMSHLTAVSGSNVVIVVGAAFVLLRLLRIGPRASAVIGGAVLLGYVILVGSEPSVSRAGVMGAVGLLALALGRNRSALPALAFSVIVLVLADPAMAVSIGFALSVVATAALVLLAPTWVAAARRRGVPAGVAEGIAVPLAAFVATTPIIAGTSGEVSLVTVAANVLATPVVAPATVLGVVAAGCAMVAPALAEAAVWLAGPLVSWLVLVAREAASVPGAVIGWPDGWWGGLVAAFMCIGVLVAVRSRLLLTVLTAGSVGVAIVAIPVFVVMPGWPPPRWVFVACDVGQGDGLVLSTGERGSAVVVDAGTELGDIDRCLDRLDVERVPMVVLSHLHADHIGGLAAVLDGRAVGAIAVGEGRTPDWAWRQVVATGRRFDVTVLELSAGQRLTWPSLRLRVLGPRYVPPPDPDADGTEVNNASVVLKAETSAGSVLLTGDVELAAQADLLAAGEDLRADVLKVPHHGSSSTLPRFLDVVDPTVAVISVGARNRYGHPNTMLIDELRSGGAAVVRTDISGDIALVAVDGGLRIVPARARSP